MSLVKWHVETFEEQCKRKGSIPSWSASNISTKSDVRIDKDVYNALGAKNVVKRYQSAGAAGGKPFEEQLKAWKERLGV